MALESPKTFSLICSDIGSSFEYSVINNPQIVLRAGSKDSPVLVGKNNKESNKGSAVELILNSSNSG